MLSFLAWLLNLSVSLFSSLFVVSANDNAASLTKEPNMQAEQCGDSTFAVVKREISIFNFNLNPSAYAEDLYNKIRPFNMLKNIKENAGDVLHTNRIDLSVIPSDTWERVISLGEKLRISIQKVLDEIAKKYHVVDKVEEFKSTMNVITVKANDLREDLNKAAEAHGVTLEALSGELTTLFAKVLDELQAEFPAPDEAPNHELREEMVSRVLDRVEEGIIHIGLKYGASETNLRAHIDSIKSPIEKLIVLTGDVIEQHPALFDVLVVTASTMLLPESFILRPLLSLFGFGPYGPVKGSAAAWCQRRFFGAVVTKGSWFSLLQRAGMKFIPPWWEKVVLKIVARIIGVGVKSRW